MKYCDIDFYRVMKLRDKLNVMKHLLNDDYHALTEMYTKYDTDIIDCLREYRTLDTALRKLDFVRLQPRDFNDKCYIYNRMKKMDRGFKVLLNFYKG